MSHLKPHENDDKTLYSYVAGFILSLIFSLIPYYLVTHRQSTASTLLLVILLFALIQLIVQVVFFLHIGRGPKPRWNLYFLVATVGIVLIVVGGSIIIIHNLHYNIAPADQTKRIIDSEGIYRVGGQLTGACQGQHANHQIIVKADTSTPLLTVADKCDTLTFVNADTSNVIINFGTRDQGTAYAGLTDVAAPKGRTKTITLSELGTFQFHDKRRPGVGGSFAVVDPKHGNDYRN